MASVDRRVAPALRFEVLQALERAQENVARGRPTLHSAFYLLDLSARAWAEVDKAMDDVRFEVPPEALEATALSAGAASSEGIRLRELLEAARRNVGVPWVDDQGLTRIQAVALLFIAREFAKRLPVVPAGELFPSLPIRSRS